MSTALAPGAGRTGHLAGGHFVYLFARTRPTQVTALMAEAGARITGGFGKWEEIAVPRGQPFTQWLGRTLLAMELALYLDGYGEHRSVEAEIRAIEELATPIGPRTPGGVPVTPPSVRIVGAVPFPLHGAAVAGDISWVIASIDWGDTIRDGASGERLRQALTLHLLEYIEEQRIVAIPPKPSPRKVKVKKGDDLKKLAAKYLGKSSRWPEIVKLNKGLRGWKLPAKWVGKTILVPAH